MIISSGMGYEKPECSTAAQQKGCGNTRAVIAGLRDMPQKMRFYQGPSLIRNVITYTCGIGGAFSGSDFATSSSQRFPEWKSSERKHGI
jgi:hypothetical protein